MLITCLALAAALPSITARAADTPSGNGLSAYIESEFEKTNIPGMSVQIVDKESILFSETYGNCTGPDSGLIIGSISKSFTAACIMQLAEQGKLELTDKIAKYLPTARQDSKTTILQLLNQTSGIATYSTTGNFESADTPAAFEYANVNYALLGQIIEKVTGTDYASYIEANIFEPLGMTRSFASLEQAKASGMEPGHRNYLGLMVEADYPYPDSSHTGWLTVPAGYIISSTSDMGRYLQMYLNKGAGILEQNSVEEMMRRSVAAPDSEVAGDFRYGLGLCIEHFEDGEIRVFHGGNVENYTTYMIFLPEQGIGMIAMFNACDYLVANGMAEALAKNIMKQYIGEETEDMGASTYWKRHIIINAMLFVMLLLSALPLIFIKRWHVKHTKRLQKPGMIFLCLVHAALPTLMLVAMPILGLPLSVLNGFGPDVFAVLLTSSILLYITGIIKIIVFISSRKSVQGETA